MQVSVGVPRLAGAPPYTVCVLVAVVATVDRFDVFHGVDAPDEDHVVSVHASICSGWLGTFPTADVQESTFVF